MQEAALDQWWETKKSMGYAMQPKHKALLSMIGEDCFPLVDLGAGTGVFLDAVEHAYPGREAFGVELSGGAILNKVCASEIVRSGLLEWEPGHRSVKVATIIDVLEHLDNPEEVLRHVAGFAPTLVIACPNFSHFSARWAVLLGRVPFQNRLERGGHVYWCQYRGLRALFDRCGYAVAEERHLYTKHAISALRALFSLRPSLMAHEFLFKLVRK
jgi:hypothetical protein